jgi:hypothetical protein
MGDRGTFLREAMPRTGRIENLKPPQTTEEAREWGSHGGKASGEARRKKKLMSQIYGEFLAEKFTIKVDGKDKDISGEDLVGSVVKKVLVSGGSAAVSLMKEIREATEGSKLALTEDLPQIVIEGPDA